MAADPGSGAHGGDLLGTADWRCASTPPGGVAGPADLPGAAPEWMAAVVPGTVAGALRSHGLSEPTLELLDGRDWWFVGRFAGPVAPIGPIGPATSDGRGWVLELDGLATLADVWLNGRHLLRSESMFTSWRVPLGAVGDDNELCLRFAALTPVLAERRPRPRWRPQGVSSQNLRWIRTTLLGRQAGWASIPAPVGPWRPLRLRPAGPVEVTSRRVRASCPPGIGGADGPVLGTVTVDLTVSGAGVPADGPPPAAVLEVAGTDTALEVVPTGSGWRLRGTVDVDGVERWWPHTHGAQPLYPVRVVVAGVDLELGEVGFRSVEVDRSDGGFGLVVNGVPVFCRGAGWYPVDPVSLQGGPEEPVASVDLARSAGMNMLRVTGGTVYEDDAFFGACDRAGILVWQDVMLAQLDPPDDDGFLATMTAEVCQLLDRTAPHPCLVVLCGGEQMAERAAMSGLPRERWGMPLLDTVLPDLVAEVAPGLVFVSSSPTGGALPFYVDAGVSHYVGVGVHRFPLEDLRRAAPRFVSETLAFAYPPEAVSVDEEFGGDPATHRETLWKRGVHRDPGSWFDLEDVRDHYTASLFAVDVDDLWRTDHERALAFGRAAMAEVVGAAVSEWRRHGSPCTGVLALALRDLRAGPGWGLVDSSGRPKSAWYAFARASGPVAVLATDEGVNGLALHLVNDTAADVDGTLEVTLHTSAHSVETVSQLVVVPARQGIDVRADALFDGFRDITYAYRFGPRAYELVTAGLVDASGRCIARADYLPGGPVRNLDPDVGLQAAVERADGRSWLLSVSARRFAQFVQVDVPGFVAGDSWFHLPPGGERTLVLRPAPGPEREPRGRVRALNSGASAAVSP
jgi:beta-mannosidase